MGTKNFTLKVWRQESANGAGELVDFSRYAKGINEDASLLEMLDLVNERLMADGERPIEFDSDCREGICGSCGCVVNGQAHGPNRGTTICQVHMRSFADGETLVVEPWRAKRRLAWGHFRVVELFKRVQLWRKFVRGRQEIGKGAHGGRKRYTGRQRWQKRHNLFLIMQHHGVKMLRSHFKAWQEKCHKLASARRAFAGHMNTRCRNVVRAWKIQSDLNRARKRIAIDEWRDYSMALWKTPFRAWYVWTQVRKREQAASRILLSAWMRKKRRDLKYQVFKVWRHQAAYGKIEGMFTRVRLLRTLDEQKMLIRTIGDSLQVSQETLLATKSALEQQIKINEDNTKRLEKSAR